MSVPLKIVSEHKVNVSGIVDKITGLEWISENISATIGKCPALFYSVKKERVNIKKDRFLFFSFMLMHY